MSLVPPRGHPEPDLAAVTLAAGLPFLFYLATASGHDYWLDSGEFTAAAIHLGIAHPPGFPLAALVGRAFAFLPFGPLPLRVALASAVAAGVACVFLFRAALTTLSATGVRSARIAVPLALGATWLAAFSPGWWLQAVRPEVYALQACLLCVVVERVVTLEARWPTNDIRPLYEAALALGLALSNHHYLAILLFPALAPTLARAYRARGVTALLGVFLCLALGLSVYLYLPLRAATSPEPNLGDPENARNFWWVLSAQVYNRAGGGGHPGPLLDRFFAVLARFYENLHALPLLLGACGAYALLRTAGARRVGYVWVAALATLIVARTYHGPIRDDPDALGYLMMGYASIAVLSAAFVANVLIFIGGAGTFQPRKTAVFVTVALAALGLAQIRPGLERASLAAFTATDEIDELRRRDLPPNAVLIAHMPGTVFRHWGGEAAEVLRPDVTLIPMPFLDYPGMVEALLAAHPELTDLVRAYLLEGVLSVPELQSLATTRPVLIELDPRVPPSVYETLVPAGAFHEVLADGATETDERDRAQAQDAALSALVRRLSSAVDKDPETRRELLWIHYMAAIYFAGVGDLPHARITTARALSIAPGEVELERLASALSTAPEGEPLDVRPFFPDAQRP